MHGTNRTPERRTARAARVLAAALVAASIGGGVMATASIGRDRDPVADRELGFPGNDALRENPTGAQDAPAPRGAGAAVDRAKRQRGGGQWLKGYAEEIFFTADDPERDQWWNQAVGANTNIARINMPWANVAPTKPASPTNPADPAYQWGNFDAAVQDAAERGQRVLLTIYYAPPWAEGPKRPKPSDEWPVGTWKPDPKALGEFIEAVANRYSGTAVDYVTVWNEANLTEYLTPQSVKKGKKFKLFAPDHYRKLVNAASAGVNRSSDKSVKVIAGATSPYGDPVGGRRTRPLQFFRDFMCLDKNLKAQKGCSGGKPKFDILSHHPITLSGGPNRSAIHPDDVAMPDFKNVVKTLRAAEKRNTVKGNKHPAWVTEFWWETNPPDGDHGVPLDKHARWVQESLYSLWKQGASAAVWFKLVDDDLQPSSAGGLQAGHFFFNGDEKPSYQAFRFPLGVDRKSKSKVSAWTIPPTDGQVVIERESGSGWSQVGSFQGKDGVPKQATVKVKGKTKLRASLGGETTIPVGVKK